MTCFRLPAPVRALGALTLAIAAGALVASSAAAQDGGAPPPSEPPPPADAPTPADEEEVPPEEQAEDAEPDATPEPAPTPASDPAPAPAPPREPSPPPSHQSSTTVSGGTASSGAARAPSTAPPPSATTGAAAPGKKDEDEQDRGSFYIEPSFGYSYVDLVTFRQDNFFPDAEQTTGNGYTIGAALGFRIHFFTIGARGNYASYEDFDLGQVMLDLGLRIPLPVVEPYIRAGIGAGWVGNTNYDQLSDSQTDVWGLVAEVGAGLDIYLSDVVSIGGGIDAAFLNFSRQKCNEMTSACDVRDVSLEEDGDAVGIQLRATGHLGLHF